VASRQPGGRSWLMDALVNRSAFAFQPSTADQKFRYRVLPP
jgi:hypothetical protein